MVYLSSSGEKGFDEILDLEVSEDPSEKFVYNLSVASFENYYVAPPSVFEESAEERFYKVHNCSLVLDFSPAGGVKGVTEAILGKDIITQDELAIWERFLAAGTVVPGVGPIAKKIGKAAKDLAKGTSSVDTANRAKKLKITAETAIKAEKTQALKKGNISDRTFEVIKGLRPEKAVLDGVTLFKDIPKKFRSSVWDIMENLPAAVRGDSIAIKFLQKYNPHPMTKDPRLKGYISLDLAPNYRHEPLRFLYKPQSDGTIKWFIKDTHR